MTEAQTRFRKAFDSQADARKSVQRKVIFQRIHEQIHKESIHKPKKKECAHYKVDKERLSAASDVCAVADPYAQSIEDLPLHELKGSEEHQDDSWDLRNGRDFSGSKSYTFQSLLDTVEFLKDAVMETLPRYLNGN